MKLTDKQFWAAWAILFLLMIMSCVINGRNEDTTLLGIAFTLSLCSTWLCHIKGNHRTAFGNLIIMIIYNVVLGYNLIFNSQYGVGLVWLFFILILNTVHSIVLFVFIIVHIIKFKNHEKD